MPVSVHGVTWTAALVALLNVIVGGALVALVKQWPRLKELAIGEKQSTYTRLEARISKLEQDVASASAAAHAAEMKLVYAVSAVQLLAAKVRADNPDDPTLRQAMELLAAALNGAMPGFPAKLGDALGKIRGKE